MISRHHGTNAEVSALLRELKDKEALSETYHNVIADLRRRPHAAALVQELRQFRRDIVDECQALEARLEEIRAQCSHAFERIGEARPPFRVCVTCGLIGAER